MGLLTHWALLVLVSWAHLFVGELKGLGPPTSTSWSAVCSGQGTCMSRRGSCQLHMPLALAGVQLQPCRASTLPLGGRHESALG